ncbi:nitrilase-related carbon-nitrogen hydrolase [Isosphaeraceae bacterium EP7]
MTTPGRHESPARSDRPFRLGVAQVAPRLGDVDQNLRMHLDSIERAKVSGVDLLVFPELSATGYDLRDLVPEVAQPAAGAFAAAVREAAGSMAVVFGFVEEDPAYRFHNAAIYVDGPNPGSIHRKVYLPTYGMFDEGRYFAPGDRIRAIPTRFGRMGLLICEDAWHLSCAVVLQAEDIDFLVILANSPARGVGGPGFDSERAWSTLLETYSTFLSVPVAFANRVGFEEGVGFWGGSRILGPGGQTLAVAPELEPAFISAIVDHRETRKQRILAPLARDERLELTRSELERIQYERANRRNPS